MSPISPALAARLAVPLPRYTSYPTVPEWSDEFSSDDYRAALVRASKRPEEPLSLYVHIPFCHRRCTYCGCNVAVSQDPTKADRYLDTLSLEFAEVSRALGARRGLSAVHWGGGTPTFLSPEQIARLWGMILAHFSLGPGAEASIEIDPTVTSSEQLALLSELGFRRLSIGVQDLDARVQEAIGRIQSLEETARAAETARQVGFGSVNFDLVYGLPRQTVPGFSATIDAVLKLRPDRIAAFAFAYVPDVRPNQRRLPVAELPDPQARLALRAVAAEKLEANGYVAIGMDHWALPGDDLAIALAEKRLWRDFQGYTTQRAKETLALGVSAISDIGGVYAQNSLGLLEYKKLLEKGVLPTSKGLRRSADDEARRSIITQILCNMWIDLGDEAPRYAEELAALAPLAEAGLVELHGSQLNIPVEGRPFVRHVASVFDTYLRQSKERRFSSAV